MRPSCDKILELPIVKRKISELFPDDFDNQFSFYLIAIYSNNQIKNMNEF